MPNNKTWDDMTQAEKTEELRREITGIGAHVSQIQQKVTALAHSLAQTSQHLDEVARAVEKLERQQ